MDEIEANFLDIQDFKPLVWFRYIDDIFFIWTHGEEKLEKFLKDFNNYHPNIKFIHEFNKKTFPYWTLKCEPGSQLTTDLHIKITDKNPPAHIHLHIQTIPNAPFFLVKL